MMTSSDNARHHSSTTPQSSFVILIAPELFAELPTAREILTLQQRKLDADIRFLIRLENDLALQWLRDLHASKINMQILTAPSDKLQDLDLGETRVAHAPKGMPISEINEFALALADAILLPTNPQQTKVPPPKLTANTHNIKDRANTLLKRQIGLASPSQDMELTSQRINHGLDPHSGRWIKWIWWLFVPFDKFAIDILILLNDFIFEPVSNLYKNPTRLFTSDWFSSKQRCLHKKDTNRKIRFDFNFYPQEHFAPKDWENILRPLDCCAIHPDAPIVQHFNILDRSALYGSFTYRGLTWITNLATAFAAFAAISGTFSPKHSSVNWAVIEFVTLFLVLVVIFYVRYKVNLHDRWTNYRLGAERLRIARMCLPIFVVPPSLLDPDQMPLPGEPGMAIKAPSNKKANLDSLVRGEVIRTARDQGLPHSTSSDILGDSLKWLTFLVNDQKSYHTKNIEKLTAAETGIPVFTLILFLVVLLAVAAHVMSEFATSATTIKPHVTCQSVDACQQILASYQLTIKSYRESIGFLYFSAFIPALISAFHGIETQLAIRHRIALSKIAEKELSSISAELNNAKNLDQVRKITQIAAYKMGNENISWEGLLRRSPISLG